MRSAERATAQPRPLGAVPSPQSMITRCPTVLWRVRTCSSGDVVGLMSSAAPLLDQIPVGRDGPGHPHKRTEMVQADEAISHPSTEGPGGRQSLDEWALSSDDTQSGMRVRAQLWW